MDRTIKRKANGSSQPLPAATRRRTSDPFNAIGNYAPSARRPASQAVTFRAPSMSPLALPRLPDIYLFPVNAVAPTILRMDPFESSSPWSSIFAAITGAAYTPASLAIFLPVDGAFLSSCLEYLRIRNVVNSTQLTAIFHASQFKYQLMKFPLTAGLNTRREYKKWAKHSSYLAYVRSCRGRNLFEIEATGRGWIEHSSGTISDDDIILTADTRMSLHILPEELQRLKVFQERCQANVPLLIEASSTLVVLSWLQDTRR